MVDIARQPDGELCHCPVSIHRHRHIGPALADVPPNRRYSWRDIPADEARRRLLEEIFGE